MTRLSYVIAVVTFTMGLAWACSDDGQDPGRDAGVDQAVVEDGAGGDGPKTKDRGPDKPKLPARWEQIKDPGPAVWDHQATLLKDGKILITGGLFKDKGTKASAEATIYLPQPKQLVSAGQMPTPRGGHTATLLDDGRVLVVGGNSGSGKTSDQVELFDPKKFSPQGPNNDTWSKAAALVGGKRLNHGAVKLKDGRVLVAGGYGSGQLDTLEIYNPKTGGWSAPGAKLSAKRTAPSVSLLNNGNVLIAGGYDGKMTLDTLEIYDVKQGTIKAVAGKLGSPRAGHEAVNMLDGRVMLVGGHCAPSCKVTGADVYNPTTGKVSNLAHPGAELYHCAAALLKDGRVLVTGGSPAKERVLIYLTNGNLWSSIVPLKVGRYDHTATRLVSGEVLVVGGQNSAVGTASGGVAQVELFFP